MNRRQLLTLAAMTGGVAVVGLAETLDAAPEGARLRTGRVTELLGSSQVVVDVGGGQLVNMPCLTQYDPILGDIVQIMQQGPVQVVLGRTSPISGDNVLANPSFEVDAPGVSPSSWTKVIDAFSSGDANVKTDTASGWGPVTGTQWLELNQSTLATAVIHVVSDAIPVQTDELWTAAAYGMNSSTDADGGSLAVTLTWYENDILMYPSTAAPDTELAYVSFPPGGVPGWVLLRALAGPGARVPAGASHMRVMLTTILRGGVGSGAYWDAVTCRKVT